MVAILINILLIILLVILIGLVIKTYTYFEMLPESNRFKGWLACDIVVLIGFMIYIGIKLACR